MKKKIALIMAAAMAFSAVPAFSASAAENDTAKDFVLFGDSIATGYTRAGNVEHNYGEILADYYDGTAANYAVVGDDSDQMLEKIKNLSAEQKKAVQDSECVVISIGGNDMMNYMSREMLTFFAANNLLTDGYTAENIPERASMTELKAMIKTDDVKAYASNLSGALQLLSVITKISSSLRVDKPGKYEGYIKNHIMKNIADAVTEIKAVNPNTKVVVQNIYQPIQIDEAYVNNTYKSSSYSMLVAQIRLTFEDVIYSFSEELNKCAADNDFLAADIYTDFTSMEDPSMLTDAAPGNAAYFVDVKSESLLDADIHPNQKGHVAIAAAIINTLGEKHNDGGLLSDTFEKFEDKGSYPAIALASYEAAAGTWNIGDVNFDGVVDARDATVALTGYAMASSGKDGLKYRENLAADVTKDNVLDGRDATFILTYYAKASAGKVGSFDEYIKSQK